MDSLTQQNNWYKHVLTIINVLSKYAWVEGIKAKTGENLVEERAQTENVSHC
jgi:hypothetical protein